MSPVHVAATMRMARLDSCGCKDEIARCQRAVGTGLLDMAARTASLDVPAAAKAASLDVPAAAKAASLDLPAVAKMASLGVRAAGGALIAALAFQASPVVAHGGHIAPGGHMEQVWSADTILVALALVVSAAAYALGIARLWRAAGIAKGIASWQMASFAAGWLVLTVALFSPIDALGAVLFSAHMVQHELLMAVAAPLLVLGRPLAVFVWALPRGWRTGVSRPLRASWMQRFWRALVSPLAAFTLHAIALWVWHVPALYEASLASDWVHAAQHASFLVSALIFWWMVLAHPRSGIAVLYVLATAIHTGALGALLTFAPVPLYPAYVHATALWELSALEDQQLGGLVMWVPAGLAMVVAGVIRFDRWISAAERAGAAAQRGSGV